MATRKRSSTEIGKAKEMGAELVVFPELTICGYLPEDLLLHGAFIESIEQHLETITRETKGIMALVGLPRKNVFQGEKPLLNSAAVIYDGHLVGFQDKWLLPTYDVFQERRYFEPGHHTRVWELNGKRVAIVICEDMWQHAGYVGYTEYARDPIQELVAYKPDILINLSASPYQMQKFDVRVEVCAKAAKTLGCPVVYCCQVGANDQLIFDGYSLQVNEKGELVHLGKGFEEDRFLCDTDEKKPPIEFSLSAMEELHHALVLGVKDYFRKQGFQKRVSDFRAVSTQRLSRALSQRRSAPKMFSAFQCRRDSLRVKVKVTPKSSLKIWGLISLKFRSKKTTKLSCTPWRQSLRVKRSMSQRKTCKREFAVHFSWPFRTNTATSSSQRETNQKQRSATARFTAICVAVSVSLAM